MTAEGRITIDIFPANGAVTIACDRPLAITRRFSGQRPEDIMRMVSLLFATCRAAQSATSAAAFENALGVVADGRTRTERALLILAETAREHALRILMDWPQFLHAPEQADASTLRSLMQISQDLSRALDGNGEASIAKLKALLEAAVFGEALDRWRARTTSDDVIEWAGSGQTVAQRLLHQIFDDGLAAAGAAPVATLPELPPDTLAERLFAEDAEEFIAKPEWEGQPCETSPLTRAAAHPLVESLKSEDGYGLGARLAACLVELAEIPAQMLELLDAPMNSAPVVERQPGIHGVGIGQVEAARGRLVHAVQMADAKVHCYRILAPTEWTFHPEGAAARGLRRIAALRGNDCLSLARLFVTAADPCVAADVRVH